MQNAPASLQRIQAFSLLILAAVALGAALHWLTPVMVPFMLAFFLTVVLTPIVEVLHVRCRLPHLPALFVTGLAGLVVVGLLGMVVHDSVSRLAENQDSYIANFRAAAKDVAALVGVEVTDADLALPATELKGFAKTIASTMLGVLSDFVLVMIFMMFLVSGRSYSGTLGEVEQRIKGYVMTKVVVSSVTGVLTWLTLMLLGVEMAVVFGLLAFLLNFIPSVGSIISTVLPLPVVIGGDYTLLVQVLAIALPGAVQFVVGNVLEPRMLGDSMSLHPVTILLALIFWGMIWGFAGTLLATPVTAIVRILLDKLPETRPLAELMAGRIPGDPQVAADSS